MNEQEGIGIRNEWERKRNDQEGIGKKEWTEMNGWICTRGINMYRKWMKWVCARNDQEGIGIKNKQEYTRMTKKVCTRNEWIWRMERNEYKEWIWICTKNERMVMSYGKEWNMHKE